jgi:hypothetical protein
LTSATIRRVHDKEETPMNTAPSRAPRLALLFSAALAGLSPAAQAVQGNFSGSEKVTVTNCGTHNGVLTGAWSVTNSEVENGRYTLQGRTTRGRFTGSGTVDGATATQQVNGSDDNGSAWIASGSSVLDGDRLRVTVNGTVKGTSCRFTSEIEAQRDPPMPR